ncbi:uncharacterized protein LOC113209510 [Frankliniella occidentalis]|uniref:Uncharacterized protein LOC113209510 n=1 Tax=Frankliniella occidentalis TaxID=133901 RepID=A0A6J1SU48_FRAOC|nr:uncharacterized protein LOC113209510 [Frankliniella occidentalis]XP_026282845.1 uncharacterized protein LOC113209510 [Frankliniella occidentalis]
MDPVGTALMTLEQLLDDVLVMVMQFLDVEDVLACRLVCKRFCGLALHPDVWRHRTLHDHHPCAGAVLHLAPCLNTLVITGEVPTLAVTTTRCAVAGLDLLSNCRGTEYPLALAVRNQESLGRLRRLELATYNLRLADVLVRTVASCCHLESLDVISSLPGISHPVVHGPPKPSLIKFRCPLDKNSASFVHAILAGHAATLEEVDLLTCSSPEGTTATLLAALPRLRSLECDDSVRGLQSVASCKMLREVCITLYDDVDRLERVVKFLRRASQLQRVCLENCTGEDTPEYCMALVEALGSRLERLALVGFEVEVVRPLLRVLPSLPALRHLDVDEDLGDKLLKGITPVTAPALTLLEIAGETLCPHAWIHGDAVKSTLAENPSLHIQLWCPNECDPEDCETCVQGCHQEVKWDEVRKIGLYSHDPDKCPSPEDHTDDTHWKRSYDRDTNVACTWIHM